MNKKLTLLILALSGFLTANAQTEKGKHLIGGNFRIDLGKSDYVYKPLELQRLNEDAKTSYISIGPSYSYFLADNLGFGVDAGYGHQKIDRQSPDGNSEINANSYFGRISLQKYFLYEKKVGIRTGPFAQYSETRQKEVYGTELVEPRNHIRDFSAGLSLDFVYFPTKKIGLIASMGNLSYYNFRQDNNQYVNKKNGVSLSFFSNATFSLYYAFGK